MGEMATFWMFSCRTGASRSAPGWWWWESCLAATLPLLWDAGAACPCARGFLLPPGVWWHVRGCVDLDPADSSTAFSTAACWGPTRKNRLLSWQGNIIRVLQAGRLRRRVYFGVSHSGWPGSLWRTWKFNVSQSPDPVLPLPVLLSSWAGTKGRPGMRCWQECRAVCEVQLRGRGVVGAAGSGEQPCTAKKRGGQRNKPPFWGHEPGRRGMWVLLRRFLVSPLCQSAFFACFSFLFPFALSFGQDFNIYHRLVG